LAPWRDDLMACHYFRIERLKPQAAVRIGPGLPYYLLLLCIKGAGTIDQKDFTAGQAWLLPAGGEEVHVDGTGSEWILTYTAEHATNCLHSN
jgi:mannose-6-phosphate isomerase class I